MDLTEKKKELVKNILIIMQDWLPGKDNSNEK